MERYDQSVTCLADDPRNLETRSNKRRTPGTLSQTNKQTISTHLMHKQNSNKDLTRNFNLRTPVCKRIKSNEATKVKQRKKQASFTNLDLSQILQ